MQVISYAEPMRKEQVRDSTLLFACGVLLIVLGVLAGMITVGTSISRVVHSHVSLYAGAAEVLIELVLCGGVIVAGVGSIRMRRWSRVIVLSACGNLLHWGAITLLVMAGLYATAPPNVPMLRQAGDDHLRAARPAPAENSTVAMLWTALMAIGLTIVLIIFLIYRSRHVAIALQEAHRTRSWIDGRPIPAIALAMALLAFALLIFIALFNMPPIPFGAASADTMEARVILAGVMIALAVFFAWTAWLIFRLNPLGPWLALLLIGLTAGGMVAAMTNEALRDSFDPPNSSFSPMELTWYLRIALARGVFVVAAYAIPATVYVLRVRRIFLDMSTPERRLT